MIGLTKNPYTRVTIDMIRNLCPWLRAEPRMLASRVRPNDHRPLLRDDPVGVLTKLAAEREALYREVADVVIDVGGRDKRDIVAEIEALLP